MQKMQACYAVFVWVSERCHIPPISCMDSDESIQNNGVYQLSNSMQFLKWIGMLEYLLIKGEDHVLLKVITLDFFPYHVMRIFYASSRNAIIFTSALCGCSQIMVIGNEAHFLRMTLRH
jgi:hypothetical protein